MVDATADRMQKMISGLNYTELDELIALAQRERVGKLDEARRSLMAEFEEKAASIGLTPDQLFGQSRGAPEKSKRGKRTEQPSAPVAVKFRSPSGQTWSGRGRKPTWLTQAEAGGQSAEEFRVHG
jgi:DNA-binding protein H-NS